METPNDNSRHSESVGSTSTARKQDEGDDGLVDIDEQGDPVRTEQRQAVFDEQPDIDESIATENTAKDAVTYHSSRTIPQETDEDDDEEFDNFLKLLKSPNRDDIDTTDNTQSIEDAEPSSTTPTAGALPTLPLPHPRGEMEMLDEDAPMPAPQIAAAYEDTEKGTMSKSNGACIALPSVEANEDGEMPLMPAPGLASASKEMEERIHENSVDGIRHEDGEMPPVPAAQTAAACEETEESIKGAMDAPLSSMPPVPSAWTEVLYEEDETQKAKAKAELAGQGGNLVSEELSSASAGVQKPPPHTPISTAPVSTPDVHVDDTAAQSAIDSAAPPPTGNDGNPGGLEEGMPVRPQSQVILPIRPPPNSMLPSPEDDEISAQPVPIFHEVEATLVPQESVYLGTPVGDDDEVPRAWLEKNQRYVFGGLVGLVVVLAAAVGISYRFDREDNDSLGVVIASSQPSETQSSLPSLGPSRSSRPSKNPSLCPTFHPSQSVAPSHSVHPSKSLVPSTSPSSLGSTFPSVSTPPTDFCFEGAINILTDKFPEENSYTLSKITTREGVPDVELIHEGSPKDESSYYTDEICLERGEYEFTVHDSEGDGLCCNYGAGRFDLVMDGWVVLEGGEFGFNQTISFSLPVPSLPPSRSSVPSQSFVPTFWPSTSLGPSFSLSYLSSLDWKQRGQTIFGEAPGDESGDSVVLSGDGTITAVGAPGAFDNDDRRGYVKVYYGEDVGSSWKELGQKIEGAANGDRFGKGLALSEDGRTLAIGAPGSWRQGDRPGHVRVYQTEAGAPGSSWKQHARDIVGEADGDESGWALTLSANGKTLAIGARNNNNGSGSAAGHVRIYGQNEDGSSWNQLGLDIDGEAAFDNSGWAVSLSSDGMAVAIGAPFNDDNGDMAGHVRVYRMKGDGSGWEQLGQDIDGEAAGDESGRSVSLSADGKTLAIGAPYNDGNGDDAGHVRVYRIDDTGLSWEQLGQDIDGEAAGDWSGRSVSLSADGKTVAIGANGNGQIVSAAGHVRVYRMEDSQIWKQVGRDIDGEAYCDNSGWAVSLSANGKTVAIGSDWSNGNGDKSGHVKVFDTEY